MDIEEVIDLVGKAIAAPNKTAAKSYIQGLKGLQRSEEIDADAAKILGDLIVDVEVASGQVSNKTHWENCVEQTLHKLECHWPKRDNSAG